MRRDDPADPKGLMHEAFCMPELTPGDCRAIFLDWALSLTPAMQAGAAVPVILGRNDGSEHPMIDVLRQAQAPAPPPARRGGRAGRGARTDVGGAD